MIFQRAATALSRRAVPAASSSTVAPVAARAAVASTQGGVTTSTHFASSRRSFAESSAIASFRQRNFSTAAAESTDGSPWTDFPMAPPDPIIGLTEVRC